MISRVYSNVQNGNYIWTVGLGEHRNRNTIRIHDQSMGETIYVNEEVWDSDVFKIVRLLNEHKYDYTKIREMIGMVNRACRHLEIPSYILHRG